MVKESGISVAHPNEDHYLLLSMIGPDWYQELSPSQLKAVDRLNCAISHDLHYHTLQHCMSVMKDLGIFFRPKAEHLQMALMYCCQNPVEFLLILYQIMNPKSMFQYLKFNQFTLLNRNSVFWVIKIKINNLIECFRKTIFVKRPALTISGCPSINAKYFT